MVNIIVKTDWKNRGPAGGVGTRVHTKPGRLRM